MTDYGDPEDWVTPCPYCGMHSEDDPRVWACTGCAERGAVPAKYGLKHVAKLLQSGDVDEAIEYANELEFVEEPTTILDDASLITADGLKFLAAGDPECERCGTQLELGEGEFICPNCP